MAQKANNKILGQKFANCWFKSLLPNVTAKAALFTGAFVSAVGAAWLPPIDC